MEEADLAREAAHDAVRDVTPDELRAVLGDVLDDAAMVPGAVTLLFARVVDPGMAIAGLAPRAAGVQLIYEGLALTRDLARAEPWEGGAKAAEGEVEEAGNVADVTATDNATDEATDQATDDATETPADPDMRILAADILVARGFYLLARTEAASKAVETVRAFGRDETDGPEAVGEGTLERDVFELAIIAGTTAAGAEPSSALLEYASELAARQDPTVTEPTSVLPESPGEVRASLSGGEGSVRSGASDP